MAGCLIVILLILSPHSSSSEFKNEIPRTIDNMVIDGFLDETLWSNALVIDLRYEVEPSENTVPLVNTTAYLIENGEMLYVAFKATDHNPQNIRAYLAERDNIGKSDFVSISLDTFSDSRRAYQFSVNAIGVQADSIIDEITGEDDTGWDAIWKSAGRLTSTGYSVEMAIPLKSLRFEEINGMKNWRIKLSRFWPREVQYEFSSVKDDRDNDCNLCQYSTVKGFSDITPANNLTIIPALTVSKNQTRSVLTNQDWQSDDLDEQGSLDVRWGINQNIFLNATINPDFSHVEADDVQLSLNRQFAISTQEKRAFFLDGANYFSNWSKLVYTRLFNQPDYGIKLTGKSGQHSYGFMSLQDKDTTFLLSDNQSSRLVRMTGVKSDNQILRYRYDSGEKTNLGLTYTNRQADDYSNELFAVDGKIWFGSSDYFKFQAISTDTENPQLSYSVSPQQSGNAVSLNYTHVERDWSVVLTHHRFEEGVRIDSGFVSRSDWVSSAVQLSHRWYPNNVNSWWKKITLDYLWNDIDNIDGDNLNNRNSINLEFSGVYQSTFGLYIETDKRQFVEQNIPLTTLSQLYTEQYPTETYEVYADFSPIAGFDLGVDYTWGDDVYIADAKLAKINTLITTAEYQLNDHWRFTLEYINETLDYANRDNIYDVHITNLRASYQINVKNSLRLTLQSESESDDLELASQLLYSYKLDPYTLFYIGYSDNAIENDQISYLKRKERTLFVKFSYAWQL